MSKATLSRAAIVSALVGKSESDAQAHVGALITSGQCSMPDGLGALSDHVAALNAAKVGKGVVTIVARRLDTDYEDRSPGAQKGAVVRGKGNVCVYGIQRMPIALYPRQWEALLSKADDIRKCIDANKAQLSFDKSE